MVTYPKDWDTAEITKYVDIYQGGTPKTSIAQYWGGGIIWVTPGEITQNKGMYITDSERKITEQGLQNSSASLLPVGTILLCTRATIGELAIAGKEMATNQGFKNLVCKGNADCVFFAYLLKTRKSEMMARAIGSTFLELSKKELSKFIVTVPDVTEQKSIAETLSCMDEHIANLTELIEKKKGIRDGALEDLVSGRTRVKGFEKLKSNNIRIDTFLKVKRGKRLVRSQLSNYANSNAKVPVYQNSVVALGYYSSPNCCPQSVFVIAAGNAGDIGFSTVPFWAADDCYYFEPNEKIHQKYLYYCLLNEQQYIYSQTRRTSIPRLSHDVLERIIILVPSIAEQKAIATVLTTMDDEIVALEEEKDKMMQIKAGAMDDLLTGRIRLTRQGG